MDGQNTKENRDYIRSTLAKNSLSNGWLVNRLTMRGVETNGATVCAALSGNRGGELSERIIGESLIIVREYEEKMNGTGT